MLLLQAYKIEEFIEIRDPLHGYISVPKDFKRVIDHRIVQRLRWVSQLPLEQLVYPSAQHSRFEHSVGTMHLAMFASSSLIKNSKDMILEAMKADNLFAEIELESEQFKQLILAAGLVGLLHDVGHAPFSHTFEDACRYNEGAFKYDHETIGFKLAKSILEDSFDGVPPKFVQTAIKVLNKDLKFENEACSPIDKILRTLVDGPIDVDKGDYVYRDSYHCGVNYGFYDIKQLWQHIVVTKDFSIGVDDKGALEAWSLRIARYKMYLNVYKHHVRNITDSLLIEIISKSFQSQKKSIEVCPFSSSSFTKAEEGEFVSWTDSSLIKALDKVDSQVSRLIELFQNRRLYKRGFEIDLSEFPNALMRKNHGEVIKLVQKTQEKFERQNVSFNFILNAHEPAPVNTKCVQNEIKVLQKKKEISLSEFLGFKICDNAQLKTSNPVVQVFIPKIDCGNHSALIQKEIKESLKVFSLSSFVSRKNKPLKKSKT